jgi:hypothetical protein
VGAAGEISFFQLDVAQHSLYERYVLGLSAVGRAGNGELLVTPPHRVETAGREEWNYLKWLGAGSPKSEGVGIARGTEELVAFSNHRSVDSMLRFGSITAGYCNIELIRFDHTSRYSS